MDKDLILDILGWAGVVALLVAYWLVSSRKLDGNSVVYQSLNLLGSALLIANSFYYRAYPSVGVNIVWIAIAIFTLSRTMSKSKRRM